MKAPHTVASFVHSMAKSEPACTDEALYLGQRHPAVQLDDRDLWAPNPTFTGVMASFTGAHINARPAAVLIFYLPQPLNLSPGGAMSAKRRPHLDLVAVENQARRPALHDDHKPEDERDTANCQREVPANRVDRQLKKKAGADEKDACKQALGDAPAGREPVLVASGTRLIDGKHGVDSLCLYTTARVAPD